MNNSALRFFRLFFQFLKALPAPVANNKVTGRHLDLINPLRNFAHHFSTLK